MCLYPFKERLLKREYFHANPAQFLAGELHMNSPPGTGISLLLPPREALGDPAQAMETLQGMPCQLSSPPGH